jgi:hypothetical protein
MCKKNISLENLLESTEDFLFETRNETTDQKALSTLGMIGYKLSEQRHRIHSSRPSYEEKILNITLISKEIEEISSANKKLAIQMQNPAIIDWVSGRDSTYRMAG